jgi:hypothetical protein
MNPLRLVVVPSDVLDTANGEPIAEEFLKDAEVVVPPPELISAGACIARRPNIASILITTNSSTQRNFLSIEYSPKDPKSGGDKTALREVCIITQIDNAYYPLIGKDRIRRIESIWCEKRDSRT